MQNLTKQRVGLTLALAYLVATLPGASCQPTPPNPPGPMGGTQPVPVPTGGSGGEGGTATGGTSPVPSPYDRCVEAKTKDPVSRRIASESGTPLSTLVHRVCSDRVIQESYK